MNPQVYAVEQKVEELYLAKHPGRDPWAEWLWKYHVLWVADKATEIAVSHDVDPSLCRVAALLHDVADSVMNRFEPEHEQKSLEMARQILQEVGYDPETVNRLVNDALAKHSCRGEERPDSIEGKVMATADALAHFETSFFPHAFWWKGQNGEEYMKIMEWALKKIEKDFNNKIFFDDIRIQIKPAFKALRSTFTE